MEKVEWWLDARGARRPADPGDQADRRRRAGRWRSRWPATTSSTTARAAGTASRSRPATGSPIADVVTNFGDGPVRDSGPGAGGRRTRGGLRPVRRGADGRRDGATGVAGDPGREPLRAERPGRRLAVLRRQAAPGTSGSRRWLDETADPAEPLVLGGDLNVAPDRRRRLGCRGRSTAGRTSRSRSGPPSGRCSSWGLVDAYRARRPEPGRFTWWDYRAGNFHKNFGMRIDHLLVDPAVADAGRRAEIDREARKGTADPVRPRAAVRRPRRAGPADRRRLGRRRRADRRPLRPPTGLTPPPVSAVPSADGRQRLPLHHDLAPRLDARGDHRDPGQRAGPGPLVAVGLPRRRAARAGRAGRRRRGRRACTRRAGCRTRSAGASG